MGGGREGKDLCLIFYFPFLKFCNFCSVMTKTYRIHDRGPFGSLSNASKDGTLRTLHNSRLWTALIVSCSFQNRPATRFPPQVLVLPSQSIAASAAGQSLAPTIVTLQFLCLPIGGAVLDQMEAAPLPAGLYGTWHGCKLPCSLTVLVPPTSRHSWISLEDPRDPDFLTTAWKPHLSQGASENTPSSIRNPVKEPGRRSSA